MCSPYTRGVYVILQEFGEAGNAMKRTDLESFLSNYDFASDVRLNRGVARKALQDLLVDGSLENDNNVTLKITDAGLRTKKLAESYMRSD